MDKDKRLYMVLLLLALFIIYQHFWAAVTGVIYVWLISSVQFQEEIPFMRSGGGGGGRRGGGSNWFTTLTDLYKMLLFGLIFSLAVFWGAKYF